MTRQAQPFITYEYYLFLEIKLHRNFISTEKKNQGIGLPVENKHI